MESFLKEYYSHWMHSGERIEVVSAEDGSRVPVVITGVDSAG